MPGRKGLQRLRLWAAATAAIFACQPTAFGQGTAPVVAPAAVRVYVHADVRDSSFMPLLMQRLARVLRPPLQIGRFELDLQPYRSRLSWLFPSDAQLLLLHFGEGVIAQGMQDMTHVYVIDEDIRLAPARFNFAASLGSPQAPVRLTIVSLARLRSLSANGTDPAPALTAQRVFKLVAKNVARLSGYPGDAGRCLFAFPSSVRQLDATPENFCEPDLGVLVQAGIARR